MFFDAINSLNSWINELILLRFSGLYEDSPERVDRQNQPKAPIP
jgi:hypothetical protein